MAISKDLSDAENRVGIPINGAYYRIVSSEVQRQPIEPKFVVKIDVAIYATSTISNDTMEVAFHRHDAPYDDINAADGSEFLDKCYSWLMAQPSMAGATAV